MSEFMSTKTAAKKWGVKPETVASWCRENKLRNGNKPCEQDKPGSPWRIRVDAIPPNAK